MEANKIRSNTYANKLFQAKIHCCLNYLKQYNTDKENVILEIWSFVYKRLFSWDDQFLGRSRTRFR